jgi:hypothetical protein
MLVMFLGSDLEYSVRGAHEHVAGDQADHDAHHQHYPDLRAGHRFTAVQRHHVRSILHTEGATVPVRKIYCCVDPF